MLISFQVDPEQVDELYRARAAVDSLIVTLRRTNSLPPAAAPTPAPELDDATQRHLAELVLGVANPNKYDLNRLNYLRAVADAGDHGVAIADLRDQLFNGNGFKFGGTHASIEKTWRAKGGQAFARQMIAESADGARQIMYGPARQFVRDLAGLYE